MSDTVGKGRLAGPRLQGRTSQEVKQCLRDLKQVPSQVRNQTGHGDDVGSTDED